MVEIKDPEGHNLLFDLPFSLVSDICSGWLCDWTILPKSIFRLDSALCNRASRSILLGVYRTMSLTEFMHNRPFFVHHKMKWTLRRQINFTELILTEFEECKIVREFFKFNGPSMKALSISENNGLTPTISEWIFQYCKHLEALCIENCPLHVVIGDIINTCPLKRLRLKGPHTSFGDTTEKILKKTNCPTVTELALLDSFNDKIVPIITAAFPNVLDFECPGFRRKDHAHAAFTKMFERWPNLHTLRLHYAYFQDNKLWPTQHSCNLKKICFTQLVDCHADELVHFLLDCASLTSVTIHDIQGGIRSLTQGHYVRIIEGINSRLEEFCIGDAYYDSSVLAALAQHCPDLRVLELTHKSDPGHVRCMVDVYKQCPSIEQLHISFNNSAGDALMQELADIATYCKNVNTLQFTQYQLIRRCDVVYLIRNCKKLKLFQTSSYQLLQEMGSVCEDVKIEYIEPVHSWM